MKRSVRSKNEQVVHGWACLSYNSKTNQYFIGFEDGKIIVHKTLLKAVEATGFHSSYFRRITISVPPKPSRRGRK